MLKIIYDPLNGNAYPDALVKIMVDQIINTTIKEYVTGMELMLYAFRVAVKENRIHHDDIIFIIDDKECRVDYNGEFNGYYNSVINETLLRMV